MKCCVGTCSRGAVYRVTFFATGGVYPFCHWHSFDKRGNERWAASVAAVESLR